MLKVDAKEATPILQRALDQLLQSTTTRGRPGADLRTACGDLRARANTLLLNDLAGAPTANCLELARKAGVTQKQLAWVRGTVQDERPKKLGATLVKNSIIRMCLATEGRVIADMTFVNRDDVNALKALMNEAFTDTEEIAADDMDQMTYRALVELHAAISFHLIETARPLPRMLRFQFAAPLTTLVIGHRLYDDAGRANELRDENKVIHPAFALPTGRALSA